MEQQRYSARRAFKYNGTVLDRGQVMSLAGCENDEKLPRLGFLTKLDGDPVLHPCGICGELFISDRQRTKHGNRAHEGARDEKADAPVMTKDQGATMVNRIMNDPDYEPELVPDETISSQEKENEQEAPIFFEKTEASVKSGAGAIEVTTPAAAVPAPVMATLPPPMPGTTNDEMRAKKPTIRDTKLLTGVDLKRWRTKKRLSRAEASKILEIGMSSIARAEKLRKHSLGPQLAPALRKALDST